MMLAKKRRQVNVNNNDFLVNNNFDDTTKIMANQCTQHKNCTGTTNEVCVRGFFF